MGKPGRELSKKKRSHFHLGVWNKSEEENTFQCVVVYRGTREFCGKLEKTLIKLWKKKDDRGLLCNFADGGDGGNTWVGPGVEDRRTRMKKVTSELWETEEYRNSVIQSMKNSDKVKQNCRNTLKDPEVRERHRREVQKVGKYTPEELKEKYGAKKVGRKWFFNTQTGETKQTHESLTFPWVPGRKPPTE